MIDFNQIRYSLEFSVCKPGISADYLENLIAEFAQDLNVTQEQDYVKVCMRTNEPEIVFGLCANLGKLEKIKIDDLRDTH